MKMVRGQKRKPTGQSCDPFVNIFRNDLFAPSGNCNLATGKLHIEHKRSS